MKLKTILMLACLPVLIFGQETDEIVHLKQQIAEAEKYCDRPCLHDTLIMNLYLNWGESIYLHQPDSAVFLWMKAKKTAEDLLTVISESDPANTDEIRMVNRNLAPVLGDIGYIFYTRGEYDKAMEYYGKSLEIHRKNNNKQGIAELLNNIGIIYDDTGEPLKALDYYHRSMDIYVETGDEYGLAYSYNNLGSLYFIQGDMQRALDLYQKSAGMQEKIGNKQGFALALNNIGIIYRNQGNIPRALEYYYKSLEIKKEINDKNGMAQTLNNLAVIFNTQGNSQKAMDLYNRSLDIYKETGNKNGLALAYNNIGLIYRNRAYLSRNNYSKEEQDEMTGKAIELFQKSLGLREEISDRHGMAMSYNSLGHIYKDRMEYDRAKDCFNKSIEISESIGDMEEFCNALNGYGFVLQHLNETEALHLHALKCIEKSNELGFPDITESALYLLKDAKIGMKDFPVSDSLAIILTDMDNKAIMLNFATLPEAGQEKYFNSKESNYWDFNSYTLLRKGKNPGLADIVYNNTLKNKGIMLKSSTAMRNIILNSKDSVLIDNYYKWIILKKEISKLYSRGKNADRLEEKAEVLEKELVKASGVFGDFKKLSDISWKDVRNNLKPGEAAVEFINFRYKNYGSDSIGDFLEHTDSVVYCALIVKKESLHPEMIMLFNESDLIKILNQKNKRADMHIGLIYGKKGAENKALYNLIWKPMEEILEDIETIYLSPSGQLHKISFAALGRDKNVLLCDQYNLYIRSSTGKPVGKDALMEDKLPVAVIFGGISYGENEGQRASWQYLEGTRNEAEGIRDIMQKNGFDVKFLTGTSASESEFKASTEYCSIMHIATHGFSYPDPALHTDVRGDEDLSGQITFRGSSTGYGLATFAGSPDPLVRSGLVFSGVNNTWNDTSGVSGEDGVLTAQEVAQTDMRNTDLVVLSACETGLGDIRGSEGVYGLQRAFKMAGVKYIIMSLWQVPDKETVEFMELFYKK
ncbi:MAG: tetratricopeptide repeat protein, partial [Bacteroidota bacterium]